MITNFPRHYLGGYMIGNNVFLYSSHLISEASTYRLTDHDKRAYYAHAGNYFAAH